MKIGKLNFKNYAAQKPLGVGPDGKFLRAAELARKSLLRMGSLHTLETRVKKQLTLERYQLEPDFQLGIIGHGLLTKAEILEHIEKETEFGQLAVRAEMEYCNSLIVSLGTDSVAVRPQVTAARSRPAPNFRSAHNCVSLKVQTRVVFCENTTDPVTSAIAAYRIANVHPAFAARGFVVVALTDANDARQNFVPEAKNSATGYIGGVGHGNVDVFTGYQNAPVLQVGAYDPAEVSAKSVHFFSCSTAVQLGLDAVHNGAKFYAGYSDVFYFINDNPGTPQNEFELFVSADSTFDICIANGKTSHQAFLAAKQAYDAAIAQVPGSAAATWLQFNRDHFVLRGSPGTVVQPFTYIQVCYPLSSDQQNHLAAMPAKPNQ